MNLKKIGKNFVWNSIGSLANASTSLLYLIIVTRINGLQDAGIFTFAFTAACLLYIVGIYSGRTYQVTEVNEKITDADYINTRCITSALVIVLALIFSIIRGYNLYKTLVIVILALLKALEAFFDVYYGIFQKRGELYKSGISMFIKAIFGTVLFLVIDIITKNIICASLAIILFYIIVFIIYDLNVYKNYKIKLEKFNKNNILYILKFGFFTFLFSFLTQYVINAPKYAIDSHSTNDIQTIYGIIAMPATIMVLCSLFLIQPFLTKLAELNKVNNRKEFNILTLKLFLALIVLGIILLGMTYLFGIPFLKLIYGINLKQQRWSLMMIILGSILYGLASILSNSLIVLRKTFIQSIIFIIVSIIAFILSEIMVTKYNLVGASLSYLISMGCLLLFYLITYFAVMKRCDNNEESIINNTSL